MIHLIEGVSDEETSDHIVATYMYMYMQLHAKGKLRNVSNLETFGTTGTKY